MNINEVRIAGRLTRDPDTRYTTKGTAVAELSVAVNRFHRGEDGELKQETDFVEITAYGKTAETVQKHLKKGREIYVEGRLKLDTWVDKETNKNRSKLKVVAESMQFVGPKPTESSEPTPSPELVAQRARSGSPAAQGRTTQPDPDDLDSIPF
jgi:single-strand DNA-binding protein